MRLQDRPRWRAAASVAFADYERRRATPRAPSRSPASTRRTAGCSIPAEALHQRRRRRRRGARARLRVRRPSASTRGWNAPLELCRDHGGALPEPARYTDAADGPPAAARRDSWRAAFLRMPYQRDALAARGMIVETFETACTWDRFPALHAAVATAAHGRAARVCGEGVRHLPVHPRLPRRPGAVLRDLRRRAVGRGPSSSGTRSRPPSPSHPRPAAARSRTTTPSAATTAPGTTASGRTCSPRPCARARRCSTRPAS